jgi:hypothetical protein
MYARAIFLVFSMFLISGSPKGDLCKHGDSNKNKSGNDSTQKSRQHQQPSEDDAPPLTFEGHGYSPPPDNERKNHSYETNNVGNSDAGTIWLVGGTWALVLVGIYSLLIAHAGNRRELRAYVSIIPDGDSRNEKPFLKFDTTTTLSEGYFSIVNRGKTPAYRLSAWVKVLPAYPDRAVFDMAEPERTLTYATLSQGDIFVLEAPGGNLSPVEPDGNNVATAEEVVGMIKERKIYVYYWGVVSYTDAFKYEWTTEFRYKLIWDAAKSRFQPPVLCSEGNEANKKKRKSLFS